MSAMMPIISVVFAFRVPAGLGIYWITTAVVQIVMQLIINRYYRDMSPETIIAKAEEKRMKKLEKKAKRKNVDTETLIRNASLRTKKAGKGNEDPYENATFKDRATLSKTPPKIKAKNVKPVSTLAPPEPTKEKKGLFKSKSTEKDTNAKTGAKPQQLKPQNKAKLKNDQQKSKDASVKDAPKKIKVKAKNVADKSLADMANKVQEFNESKGSSKKGKK